ncbi:aminotransferase class III-fold pyridoxal phosphate-dependent enzyme [Selenihalanaerobacter shriftii]|uniref:Aminotransferase class-III n=1 Tax=Selenihalanaerobacter shriftii TaxID=142842 RepID=A0A1T4JQS5_9FIRM|nr:aminotransferase class III-fold pyridoxal phosphate-dependent enzyme [Selenihalanaerobacter shriftii]SJZ32504.1 Aminotransferase class-III [Selenihalanaerobacter shriftii]
MFACEHEDVIGKIQPKIKEVADKLEEFGALDHVGDLRQRGLMIGIELVKDKVTKEPYDWQKKIGAKVCMKAREKRMIIRTLGSVVVFMPSLCSTKKELQDMLDIIYECIEEVTE